MKGANKMRTYEVQFYSEWNLIDGIVFTSRSNNKAIEKAIKINITEKNCKYIQVWRLKKSKSIKIFGNGNKYLYGIRKGSDRNVR